jgi:hypothetical protein
VADELDPLAIPWSIDPGARVAMLLHAARDAHRRGDAVSAVLLAEEALDEVPDEIDALLLVADAAPRYGHAEVGLLAARQAAAAGRDTRVLQAAALLAGCDVEAALALARETAGADGLPLAERARAHAVIAQALDLKGEDAQGAYAAARALRPDAYPRPLVVPEPAWDALVHEAVSGLDPELRDVVRARALVVRDAPDLAELRALAPPPSPTADVLALDEGQPRIEVYRRNLVRGAASLDEVLARLLEGLENEARGVLEAEES